jgi:glycosyltransferase involved in cell wall biosynthesis
MVDLGIEPLVVASRAITPRELHALSPVLSKALRHMPGDPISLVRGRIITSQRLLRLARAGMRGGHHFHRSAAGPLAPEGTGRLEYVLESHIADQLADSIEDLCRRARPDLVHALKVPFEGVAASRARTDVPLAISIWGRDLDQQAPAHRALAEDTRRCLRQAAAVHADCARDLRLAHKWGASESAPTLLAAGNMGYDSKVFYPRPDDAPRRLVVMPRGLSSPINHQAFLRAVQRLHPEFPDVVFVGVGLAGEQISRRVQRELMDPSKLVLTSSLSQPELAYLYRQAYAVVSPSNSDGTPNSLIEAMASGAIPLAGNIDSLRDLLTGLPGNLFAPDSASEQASAIRNVLEMTSEHWKEMSRVVRAIAMENWSREVTLKRTREWYASFR